MDDRRSPQPDSSLPAVRSPAPPPAVPDPRPEPDPGPEPGPDRSDRTRRAWRRITRTRRGAVGLGIAAAALLLWPFAEWSVWPWAAGAATLVLLRLLRLDGLLRGWLLHLAGLVVVGVSMLSTGPWAWALAASLGVLLAGLVQLPEWRVAAVGAGLCVVTGTGYAFSSFEWAEAQRRVDAQRSEQSFSLLGERSPERVLPALIEGIGQGDTVAVCGLLDESARAQFVRASGAPDCPAAVVAFRATLGPDPQIRNLDAPVTPRGEGWVTDGCRTRWASVGLGGPALGTLEVRRSEPPGRTYFIADLRPC